MQKHLSNSSIWEAPNKPTTERETTCKIGQINIPIQADGNTKEITTSQRFNKTK